MRKIKIGSDFSGVGAFDYAIQRVAQKKDFTTETVYACDWDKYARITYAHNHGEPSYYPKDVYDREIPEQSLDLYVTSPPCFVGSTLVNTKDGFKQIMNLKIGDQVLTHKNRYRSVVDFGSKMSPTVVLKAQGIIDTETTSNHRYYVRKRYRQFDNSIRAYVRKFTNPEWVEAKDLTKDHFIGINIPNIEDNPYSITKDVAYVLGRYVADGWLRIRNNENGQSQGNSVTIAIGKDKVEEIGQKIRLKHTISDEIRGTRKLHIYSNKLVDLILKLELGRGAENKRIPQSIINLPKSILQEFVSGYMDGDGHQQKDFFRATSVSKELLMGFQLCVAKLYRSNSNIKYVKTPETTIIEGRTVNQKDYYVLEFRTEMRKQSNAVIIDDVIWYPIRSVEQTNKEQMVYDITVQEDHSFTANQAIVHNCQAFSLAGKRLGKEDKRGILFFNSHEFIQTNKPRFFIFENVKGLLSDDSGKTFQEWVNMLGGKSVNGVPILFPYEDSVPYHLYWKVINAKHHNVPQNRERVFIIGIRDDQDNKFSWPIEEPLKLRLKDVLETEVFEKYFLNEKQVENMQASDFNQERERIQDGDYSGTLLSRDYKSPKCVRVKSNLEKYYLSQKMIDGFMKHNEHHEEKGTGFIFSPKEEDDIANCLRANASICATDNTLKVDSSENNYKIIGYTRDEKGKVIKRTLKDEAGTIHCSSGKGVNTDQFVLVSREVRTEESKKKRKETGTNDFRGKEIEFREQDVSNTITTSLTNDHLLKIKPEFNDKRLNETLDKHELPEGKPMIIDTYNKSIHEECPTLKKHHAENGDRKLWDGYKIRRLTPRECFRLMNFPETFDFSCVSDSQAYKQAGNSIVVRVLEKILDKLPL